MRKLAYLLASVVVVTLYADFAVAHAVLLSSSPAGGALLSQAPGEIRLSFNEGVEARFSSVTVTRSDGKKVSTGRPAGDAQKRSDLVVPLPALQPGRYQVRWQATSADSHRIQGSFAFEIRP
jgi:methionine-rich copper-binding protein CopC